MVLREGMVAGSGQSASLGSDVEFVVVRVAVLSERPALLSLSMLLQQRSDLSYCLRLWTGAKLYFRYLATMLKPAAQAVC